MIADLAGPDPVDVHVGRRVRLRRRWSGLSQTALATRIEVTFQQVQKYERGANRISVSKLYRIAEALRTPIDYFFEGLPDPCAPGAVTAVDWRSLKRDALLGVVGGAEMADAFLAIRPAVRRRLVALAKELAQPTDLGVAAE